MNAKAKVAVVLSGCGVYDGSEIHEAVLTLLALDRHGAAYACFAPDMPQMDVIDHCTGKPSEETRNVLVESARIARGKVRDLAAFRADEYDAIIFPGGFGAAKNLSTFAVDGADCTVRKDVETAVRAMVRAAKPIAALCISPVIMAKIMGNVDLTIGDDAGTASAVQQMGAKHRNTRHGEVVIDPKARLVTTPCYMLDSTIGQIADGADHAVAAMLAMITKVTV